MSWRIFGGGNYNTRHYDALQKLAGEHLSLRFAGKRVEVDIRKQGWFESRSSWLTGVNKSIRDAVDRESSDRRVISGDDVVGLLHHRASLLGSEEILTRGALEQNIGESLDRKSEKRKATIATCEKSLSQIEEAMGEKDNPSSILGRMEVLHRESELLKVLASSVRSPEDIKDLRQSLVEHRAEMSQLLDDFQSQLGEFLSKKTQTAERFFPERLSDLEAQMQLGFGKLVCYNLNELEGAAALVESKPPTASLALTYSRHFDHLSSRLNTFLVNVNVEAYVRKLDRVSEGLTTFTGGIANSVMSMAIRNEKAKLRVMSGVVKQLEDSSRTAHCSDFLTVMRHVTEPSCEESAYTKSKLSKHLDTKLDVEIRDLKDRRAILQEHLLQFAQQAVEEITDVSSLMERHAALTSGTSRDQEAIQQLREDLQVEVTFLKGYEEGLSSLCKEREGGMKKRLSSLEAEVSHLRAAKQRAEEGVKLAEKGSDQHAAQIKVIKAIKVELGIKEGKVSSLQKQLHRFNEVMRSSIEDLEKIKGAISELKGALDHQSYEAAFVEKHYQVLDAEHKLEVSKCGEMSWVSGTVLHATLREDSPREHFYENLSQRYTASLEIMSTNLSAKEQELQEELQALKVSHRGAVREEASLRQGGGIRGKVARIARPLTSFIQERRGTPEIAAKKAELSAMRKFHQRLLDLLRSDRRKEGMKLLEQEENAWISDSLPEDMRKDMQAYISLHDPLERDPRESMLGSFLEAKSRLERAKEEEVDFREKVDLSPDFERVITEREEPVSIEDLEVEMERLGSYRLTLSDVEGRGRARSASIAEGEAFSEEAARILARPTKEGIQGLLDAHRGRERHLLVQAMRYDLFSAEDIRDLESLYLSFLGEGELDKAISLLIRIRELRDTSSASAFIQSLKSEPELAILSEEEKLELRQVEEKKARRERVRSTLRTFSREVRRKRVEREASSPGLRIEAMVPLLSGSIEEREKRELIESIAIVDSAAARKGILDSLEKVAQEAKDSGNPTTIIELSRVSMPLIVNALF